MKSEVEPPEVLVFHRSLASALFYIVLLSVTLILGLLTMIPGKVILGGCMAFISFLCLSYQFIQLLPGACSLTLTPDGLQVVSLFRRTALPWSHVSTVTEKIIKGHRSRAELIVLKFNYDSGRENGEYIVVNRYAISHEELLDLFHKYHRWWVNVGSKQSQD